MEGQEAVATWKLQWHGGPLGFCMVLRAMWWAACEHTLVLLPGMQ